MGIQIDQAILDNLSTAGALPIPLSRTGLVRVQPGDWRFLSIGPNTVKLTRYQPPVEVGRQLPRSGGQFDFLLNACWIPLPMKIPYSQVIQWQEIIRNLDDNGRPINQITIAPNPSREPRRSHRGSRRHMLDLISSPDFRERVNALIGAVGGSISVGDHFRPKGHNDSREYELPAFVREAAGLMPPGGTPSIGIDFFNEWWPSRGPSWDLVATCLVRGRPGLLMVEAKAHELETPQLDSCKAEPENLRWIINSLAKASNQLQAWPGTTLSADRCYQLSNRIAWAWKAATAGIPVILLYLGFTGDRKIRPGAEFNDSEHWQNHFDNYSKGVVPPLASKSSVEVANGGQLHLVVGSLSVGLRQEYCPLSSNKVADTHDFGLKELFRTRLQNGDSLGTLVDRLRGLVDWGVITVPEQVLLNRIVDLMVDYADLDLDEVVSRCERVRNELLQISATNVAQLIAELTLRAANRERDNLNSFDLETPINQGELVEQAVRGCRRIPTAEDYDSTLEVTFCGAVAGAYLMAEFGSCSAYHGAVVGSAISALHCFDASSFEALDND